MVLVEPVISAMKFVRAAMPVSPKIAPTITRQEAIPVRARNTAPTMIHKVLVSPIEPGIQPMNKLIQEKSNWVTDSRSVTASWLNSAAGTAKAVAPE